MEDQNLRQLQAAVEIAFQGRARSAEHISRFTALGDRRGLLLAIEDERRYARELKHAMAGLDAVKPG